MTVDTDALIFLFIDYEELTEKFILEKAAKGFGFGHLQKTKLQIYRNLDLFREVFGLDLQEVPSRDYAIWSKSGRENKWVFLDPIVTITSLRPMEGVFFEEIHLLLKTILILLRELEKEKEKVTHTDSKNQSLKNKCFDSKSLLIAELEELITILRFQLAYIYELYDQIVVLDETFNTDRYKDHVGGEDQEENED